MKYNILLIIALVFLTGCEKELIVEKKETKQEPKIEEKVVSQKVSIYQQAEQEVKNIPVFEKEENVVEHFEAVEQDVMTLLEKEKTESVKEKIAEKFIILVDFIYYDTEMGGVKFKDLTISVQESLKEIVSRMDHSINSKIPGYKETLKEKYHMATTYIKEKATSVTEKIGNKVEEKIGEENYNNFVEAKDDLKETTINTAKKVGDVASKTYQSGKEKVKDWYQNLKEKYGE